MKQSPEAQFQAARIAQQPATAQPADAGQPAGVAPQAGTGQQVADVTVGGRRPSNLVLAGAGSLLAVLAFLGGMAVGHSWDGSSNQQGQFGGGGGRGGFPGNGQGFGNGTGQNGTGQNGTGQNGTGQNGTQQGTVPGSGNQQQGQTQTS
jgi:hypothetical protein